MKPNRQEQKEESEIMPGTRKETSRSSDPSAGKAVQGSGSPACHTAPYRICSANDHRPNRQTGTLPAIIDCCMILLWSCKQDQCYLEIRSQADATSIQHNGPD
jgi:hypothetical protein